MSFFLQVTYVRAPDENYCMGRALNTHPTYMVCISDTAVYNNQKQRTMATKFDSRESHVIGMIVYDRMKHWKEIGKRLERYTK